MVCHLRKRVCIRAAVASPSLVTRDPHMSTPRFLIKCLRRCAVGASLVFGVTSEAGAQWVTTFEQFYLEAPHNWQFRDRYMAADRLFNAFDYGHAILYERLWTQPGADPSLLEQKEYDRLTKKILVKPPRVPLEEGAIEIAYVQLAPEAKQMFEWAHVLHRQIYDVLADERLTQAKKDSEVARLIAYYKSRPDVAFSSYPKSMALMQEQPYSLAFRQKYPKFNGLIWGYHWLQVGLYEPLVTAQSSEERQSLIRATVARFWQMLQDPPRTMPHQMPMTPAVAPKFSERYTEAAIIFDNLHSMHDVISDILANPSVPRNRKRSEILLAARRYRDDTSFVISREAWLGMAQHMGIENMGGPSVGFLSELPTPTVTYGAVMTHDERTGAMTGFKYGEAIGGAHAGHTTGTAKPAAAAVDPHAAHKAAGVSQPAADSARSTGSDSTAKMGTMTGMNTATMDMHMRMFADPVIRKRIAADTGLQSSIRSMIREMPAEHRSHMESMLEEVLVEGRATNAAPVKGSAAGTAKKPAASTKRPAPAKTPPKKPVDPHAGHQMPPAKKP